MKKISTAHMILLAVVISEAVLSWIIQGGNTKLSMVVSLLISQSVIILPFVIYCIIKKQNPLKLIRFKKISVLTAVLSVAVALCSYPVVVCLNLISMLFVDNVMVDVVSEVLPMGLAGAVALLALSPAVIEETIFRGVIYNSYSKRRPLLGVFLSAFLFGIMHMNFNQMPYAMFLGIVMALLMEACDSIIAPMIMHFTINGGSTILSFLTADVTGEVTTGSSTDFKSMLTESYALSMEQSGIGMELAEIEAMYPIIVGVVVAMYVIIAVIALAIVLGLIYGIFCINKRKPSDVFKADYSDTQYIEKKNGKMQKNRIIDFPVLLFIVYALVMCVRNL